MPFGAPQRGCFDQGAVFKNVSFSWFPWFLKMLASLIESAPPKSPTGLLFIVSAINQVIDYRV